jgi:peptide deformylase
MIRELLELGHPKLREVAQPVAPEEFGSDELLQLIEDLIETMRARHGAGIAATQIGVAKRVFVIEVNDNPRYPYKPKIPLTVLVNPQLRNLGDDTISVIEGCLSVPKLRGRVERFAQVELTAKSPQGQPLTLRAHGLSAGTLQHELDHLDGLLFTDRLESSDQLYSKANYDLFFADDFQRQAETINKAYPEPIEITKHAWPSQPNNVS